MIKVGDPLPQEDTILKHAQIIKEELINEMDKGLDFIQKSISKMYGGITGWVFNPIAKLIYNILARKDIRDKAINQIDIVLECSMKYDGTNLEELIEEYIDDYMCNDQSFHRCKKNHKAYPKIEHLMKELFKSRIEPSYRMLMSSGSCYEELTQNAYTSKEDALAFLQKELEFSYQVLDVVKENKSVMKIPSFIRNGILRIMEMAQQYAKNRLTERINEIYEFNGHEK
ncbi:MAG: hypothetical protein ACTSRS_18765 [Candidatus Helarchaeota archaeon]